MPIAIVFIGYFLLLAGAAVYVLKGKAKGKANIPEGKEEDESEIGKPEGEKQTGKTYSSISIEEAEERFRMHQNKIQDIISTKNKNNERLVELEREKEDLKQKLEMSLKEFESLKEVIEGQKKDILDLQTQGVELDEDEEDELYAQQEVFENFYSNGGEEEIDDPDLIF